MPDVPLPAAHTTTDTVAASTTFLTPARASRVARVSVAALGAWLAFWLWCGRYHMLDDALIHLRYAEQLRSSGLLTYNGGAANFGTSSLLYVALLAVLRPWVSGPLLPKLLSCGVYVGLWLVIGVWRARAASRVTFGAWSLLWFALSGPLAVRWLTDGMETGLTLVSAIAVAASLHRLGSAQSVSWRQLAIACVMCGWSVVLRIELCLLVAVIGCAALRLAGVRGVRAPSALRFGPVFGAAACSVLGVWLWTGHLLPDTAIAKAHGGALDPDSGRAVLTTVASSGSLGIGLCVAWLVSWWLAATHERAELPSTSAWLRPALCANALFPVLVVLIVARGQAVQGVRYLAWAWVASVTWNLLTLDACARRSASISGPVAGMALRLGAALIWLLWAAESSTTWRILAGRSETFLHMSESDWTGFSGARAVAADIGFLGYFSRAEVCDLNGLINGRAFARLSSEQRARHCAEWRPVVAFLTESQRRLLTPYLDLAGWTQCGHVDFTNFASLDRHALLLHPQSELRCPAGFRAQPAP